LNPDYVQPYCFKTKSQIIYKPTSFDPMIKKPSSWRVAPSKSPQLECFPNSMLNQTYLTLPILGKQRISGHKRKASKRCGCQHNWKNKPFESKTKDQNLLSWIPHIIITKWINNCITHSHTVQGVPKKPKSIEINALFEFECPSTKLTHECMNDWHNWHNIISVTIFMSDKTN
jgi:hypothetical protein